MQFCLLLNVLQNLTGKQDAYEPIGRLKERVGKGLAEGVTAETPSKRTKKTDKAKLVRQVRQIVPIDE